VGPATMAATAKADGYTVSQIPTSVLRYPHMMKVNWDPLKDFTYIVHLTGYTFGVVVKKDAPGTHGMSSWPTPKPIRER